MSDVPLYATVGTLVPLLLGLIAFVIWRILFTQKLRPWTKYPMLASGNQCYVKGGTSVRIGGEEENPDTILKKSVHGPLNPRQRCRPLSLTLPDGSSMTVPNEYKIYKNEKTPKILAKHVHQGIQEKLDSARMRDGDRTTLGNMPTIITARIFNQYLDRGNVRGIDEYLNPISKTTPRRRNTSRRRK